MMGTFIKDVTNLSAAANVIDLLKEKGEDPHTYITAKGFDIEKLMNDLKKHNLVTDQELNSLKSSF